MSHRPTASVRAADASWEIHNPLHIRPLLSCGTLGKFYNWLNLISLLEQEKKPMPAQRVPKPPTGWLVLLLPLPPPSKQLLATLLLPPETHPPPFTPSSHPKGWGSPMKFPRSSSSASLLPPSPSHATVRCPFSQTCDLAHAPVVLWPQSPNQRPATPLAGRRGRT